VAYINRDTLALVDKGDGDVSEMLSHCNDTTAAYGIFRITEQYDKTTATKFCFVHWSPPNIPVMQKAKMSTHKGAVTPLFRPFHQDFVVAEQEELTEEIAKDKIASLTGTKSHVTTRRSLKMAQPFVRKFLGGVKGETQKLEFVDKDAILDSIADVRNDNSSTSWCVAGFEGGKKLPKLALVASGSGGLHEMADCFKEDQVMFGLLRNKEQYDRSTVVRFYYVQWKGAAVSMAAKGHTGVFSGAVSAIFTPYHDDFLGETVDDLLANARGKIKDL